MKILEIMDKSFICGLERDEFEEEFKDIEDNCTIINEKGIFIKNGDKRIYIGDLKGCGE